jgi:predicted DNA-binding transcriptional regulator AlpA
MTFDFASDEKLIGIEEICAKLGVSRATFERMRKPRNAVQAAANRITGGGDDFANMPVFPEPLLMLGRSPRWSVSALNTWIKTCGSVTAIITT